MTFPKVLHRVLPFKHEDVTGFLMRVSARNHLLGPSQLQTLLTGTPHRQISVRDLPKLAQICRNTQEEISQLSGYEWRISGDERAWRVGEQWVTKPVFISLRRTRVCPCCLREENYLRGDWALGFLSACAVHDTRLLEKCPSCHRSPAWNRRNPRLCNCGYDLSRACSDQASPHDIALARVFAYHIRRDAEFLQGIPFENHIIERLAGLSIDGTCKTIWFLGHCLADIGNCYAGHGRKKPSTGDVGAMVERAFCILQNWPSAIGDWLSDSIRHKLPGGFSAAEYQFLLAPAMNYFHSSVNTAELNFLSSVFEQHIRKVWLMMGRRHPKCEYERQFELRFD